MIHIVHGALDITDGLHGNADLQVRTDTTGWLQFVRKERSIVDWFSPGSCA